MPTNGCTNELHALFAEHGHRDAHDWDNVSPNGLTRVPLRWVLRRRTPTGRVTCELRFLRLSSAIEYATERFPVKRRSRQIALLDGKRVKAGGGTIGITRR
jgi:hypothetical protein